MPNLIDYLLENDDVRRRIMMYLIYFMCIGGATYSVSLLMPGSSSGTNERRQQRSERRLTISG